MKAGDVVRLKAGGELMTVDAVETNCIVPTVSCVWFEDRKLRRDAFDPDALDSFCSWCLDEPAVERVVGCNSCAECLTLTSGVRARRWLAAIAKRAKRNAT